MKKEEKIIEVLGMYSRRVIKAKDAYTQTLIDGKDYALELTRAQAEALERLMLMEL